MIKHFLKIIYSYINFFIKNLLYKKTLIKKSDEVKSKSKLFEDKSTDEKIFGQYIIIDHDYDYTK